MRYGSGEIGLTFDDLDATGFGLTWGHRRSFMSRLSVNSNLGNGFNWHVEQWPYLTLDWDGNVAIQRKANETLWFDKTDGDYVADFFVTETLILDFFTSIRTTPATTC